MTSIIGVVDGIAFQTNILALNAAVEAPREIESPLCAGTGQTAAVSLVAGAGAGAEVDFFFDRRARLRQRSGDAPAGADVARMPARPAQPPGATSSPS